MSSAPTSSRCSKCEKRGIIVLQHGILCQNHFLSYFEEKVFKTINKYNLLNRNDKICVAASGGKDSLAVLYLIKKYLEENKIPKDNLFALVVDEGIDNYRKHTLADNCQFLHQQPTQKDYLFALVVDEGIDNYRKHTLADLKEFCDKYVVPLKIV